MSLKQLLINNEIYRSIQQMLDDFCDLTGLAAVLNDEDGNKLTELSNISSYCEVMRSKGNLCCISDRNGADIAAKVGETCIYICHAGLIDFAIPIIVDGDHIGSIMAGQVRSTRPMPIDFSSPLECEDGDLLEKFNAIPFMDETQIQKSARVLEIIRKYIVECIEKERIKAQETFISDNSADFTGFSDLSRRIGEKMRGLHYMEGKILLYDLLDSYILNERSEVHLQLYEKMFKNQMASLELSIPTQQQVLSYEDVLLLRKDKTCLFYLKMYDILFEDIILNKRFRERNELDYATAYLHRYYYKKLSNKDIASYVNMSADYFSRLFKRHTGITWQDYLTTKRISVAKLRLKKTEDSILNIALQLGYSDSNYFSRVFKKTVGHSPKEYRDYHRTK